MIRTDPTLVPDPLADLGEGVPAPRLRHARPARKSAAALIRQPFPSLAAAPVPAWARASGRAGQGDPLFFAGAGLALLDAFLRRDPPCAGALRSRLALMSAAASAKILRLNADEGALRDLCFAVGDDPGPAAKLLRLWRELTARPPSLDAARLATVAAQLELAVDPNGLAASLKACAGEGDPVSAAAKAAALAFCAVPDAPAAEPEILALWVFDMVVAMRLHWPRPVPLTPFCLSSGDSGGVDFLATLRDEREDFSREVTLQRSNGVEFGMAFCDPTSNIILGSLIGP